MFHIHGIQKALYRSHRVQFAVGDLKATNRFFHLKQPCIGAAHIVVDFSDKLFSEKDLLAGKFLVWGHFFLFFLPGRRTIRLRCICFRILRCTVGLFLCSTLWIFHHIDGDRNRRLCFCACRVFCCFLHSYSMVRCCFGRFRFSDIRHFGVIFRFPAKRPLINLDGVHIFSVFHQIITFSLLTQHFRFICQLSDLLIQSAELFQRQITDLLEHRKDKISHLHLIVIQMFIQIFCQFLQSQLIPDPETQFLVQDRTVQQIYIMIKIIAQFFDGIDIGTDVFNIIRQFCPFYLTQNISAHSSAPRLFIVSCHVRLLDG